MEYGTSFEKLSYMRRQTMEREHICTSKIIEERYCSSKTGKNYILDNNTIFFSSSEKDLRITYQKIESLDINLYIKGNIILNNLLSLKSISGNIEFKDFISIKNCPLLKELPTQLIFDKTVYLIGNQIFSTHISPEQFKLAKQIVSDGVTYFKNYDEYYSFIEETLQKKNKLLNICL